MGSVFGESFVNVANCTVVDALELLADFIIIGNTESTQEGSDRDLTTAIDLDVQTATSGGLKFEPSTATRNHFSTVIALTGILVSGKEHTSGTHQLRNDHAFSTVNNKGSPIGHPRIVTEVNILFFGFAENFVSQFNFHMQWSCIGGKIHLGRVLILDWIFEIIIFEP